MDRKNRLLRSPKKLSVLIPSLRTRLPQLGSMLDKVARQVDDREDIEILSLVDAKTMTLGRKRNLLMDMAQGEYLTFVNDDDDISPNWLEIITANLDAAPGVDVLSVRAECKMRPSPFQPWRHSHIMATSLECPVGVNFTGKPSIFLHKPVMWCVWRSDVARMARFLDRTYGEDNPWAVEACKAARTEVIVAHPIYCYYADDATSEAGPWRGEFDCGIRIENESDPQAFVHKFGPLLEKLGLIAETPKAAAAAMVNV